MSQTTKLASAHHEQHLETSISTYNSILYNQTQALAHLVNQYKSSTFSQNQLKKSLNILNSTLLKGGKIVISGIGKSHKIASKVVATLNSLSLNSALLHPSEALHGDLGILRQDHHDCLIFISSSGKSPELIQLLPHISPETPIILLTNKKISLLSQHPQINSLLYAELPPQFSEESVYGLTAPTISTTLCLALADAVSIALAELYISDYNERKKVFSARHPGGAIGEGYGSLTSITNLLTNNSNYASSISLNSSEDILSPALNSASPTDVEEDELLRNEPVTFQLGFDGLEHIDHDLISEAKKSKHVLHLQDVFKDEAEIFQAIALYDYVIIKNTYVTSSDRLKGVIRNIHEHQYQSEEQKIKSIHWRINSVMSRFII